MKRQGKEGFTFDPPASEWDYWATSDKANASTLPRGPNGRFVKRATGETRANPDPYNVVQWPDTPRKAPLWPFAAIAVVAAVAAAVLWWWG